ncbi:Blue (type 1) copper domain protein [Fusarium beomiforme]|uniref:Blue (Type 1) copper domain protein n=1 Tax=Fusarium beomiforme TaxID=44412 RepID=A0A9P5AGP8_9HYPO|nr:Blue (type 1) copper domain protein [Fusarium beomiforme]
MASASTRSIAISPPDSSFQPFQCQVCSSRFTRHENLKRHAALHSRSSGNASIPCHLCPATFSRPDLRHRHMKRKHLDQLEKTPRGRRQAPTPPSQASEGDSADQLRRQDSAEGNGSDNDACLSSSLSSDHGHRAQMAATTVQSQSTLADSMSIGSMMLDASDSQLFGVDFLEPPNTHQSGHISASAPGTSLLNFSLHQGSLENLLYGSVDLSQGQNDWYPSTTQITQGCQLYFKHISHFLPFLHQPTFSPSCVPSHLLFSMLCLAYQYSQDPDCIDQEGSGVSLSERCFHRARALVSGDDYGTDDSTHNLSVIQSCILLEIYAMMYLCGNHSAYALKTHSKMVSLARSSGLSLPISGEPTPTTSDLDSLWYSFIEAESRKRTLFASHQIDSLWYQFLSIPRQFSHLEIKYELPSPEDQWTAPSAAEWAHKRLVSITPSPPVQYPDAVRRFLSDKSEDLSSFPAFDPYGAINITYFLVSSAQEISGWCTMTGMISTERLEPLQKSLDALGPIACSGSKQPVSSALCEATWQSAMIEVRMWSPSHTGGIVGGTMDAVLQQSTYLAPSCELLCETNTAKAIKPHIAWFLTYLDAPVVPDSEAPWVVLYAFKAFIIAWQLIQGTTLEAMRAVGIEDGDTEGALEWARTVFGRRQRWQLGKIIMKCLDTL